MDGVYIYMRAKQEGEFSSSQYRLQQQIQITPRKHESNIGDAMAIYGDHLVLGSSDHVYLYHKTAEDGMWELSDQVKPLMSLNGMSRSIALHEDVVAVGLSPPVYPFGQGGSVVVYCIDQGKLVKQQTLVGVMSDFFGLSVALNDGFLAIGAPEEVYMYEQQRSGNKVQYRRKQKLTASNGSSLDLFGQHVALHKDKNLLLIGAYLKDGPGGGSAYVFSRKDTGQWTQDQELKGDRDIFVTPAAADASSGSSNPFKDHFSSLAVVVLLVVGAAIMIKKRSAKVAVVSEEAESLKAAM